MLRILVGSLETPHINYLFNCEPIPCAPNSNGIAQAIDDAVRSPNAANYVEAARAILKNL